ncbi:MFS transporter [Ascobolus immersus RN42]|uniref:MFS transporter n=1 Tax=Ascobolus immersus RN42 TaxID=1160509 RepID=A0A3N4I8F1_ASCIM|nr:MFS transporter [Ascobolus immersus RN42]
MSTLGAPGGPGPGFSPPDGGLQAWLTVTAGFIAQFCSFGFLNAMGIFHHVYQEDLLKENSASQISWILTFQFFLMFFLGQTMGVAVDMWGPKMVLIPSSIVAVTGLILLSFAKTYWQVFLAQGVVFGIGVAGIFMPGLVVTGQFFARRRGMAMGIVAAGSSVGGVVFPIFLHNMLEPHGFSNTLRYTAAMMAGLMAIACACISSPFPPKGWVARRGVVSLESFKKKEYLLFCIGAFFVFWGLFGPFDYLPQQTSQTPKLSSLSIYSIVILNGASLPGRIIPAILADKFGRFNIIIPIVFLCSISVMAMWIPLVYYPNLVGIILFAIVFGFVSGGFLSVMNPCIADLCDNIQELGTRIGGFLMVAAVASLTGLPIQGVIFDKLEGNDRFMGLITFSGVTMGIGAGFVSWAGVRVNGIIARRKREEFGLQRREV